jgi:5,10-methylenetetrahydromethanopterin reductase
LREALHVLRALLAGETVRFDGAVFRLDAATLRVPPAAGVPLAVGTRSPEVARLAGELADRALVGARYLSVRFADTYRSWVAEGARRAGRDAASVEIAPRLTLCCSPEREAAYSTMRRDAGEFLVTVRPDDLDIEQERFEAIERVLSTKRGWYFDPDAYHPPELDDLVDDRLVEAFSICGTAQDVEAQLRRISAMGFGSASLKLAPVRRPGSSMFDGLYETITSAAGAVRALRASPPGG